MGSREGRGVPGWETRLPPKGRDSGGLPEAVHKQGSGPAQKPPPVFCVKVILDPSSLCM